MTKSILGKKLGMTQKFMVDSSVIPVTVLQIEPAIVVQKKTVDTDGYDAIQIGVGTVKKTRQDKYSKPYRGHFKDKPLKHTLKEFRTSSIQDYEEGQVIDASIFAIGDMVDVAGMSKGRGFAGVVKRYGFAGGPASHGHRFHRTTGSIGNRKFPGRVFKNKKMPGHMGNKRITIQNLPIVEVDVEKNCLLVKGPVPGPNGGYVEITSAIKKLNKK